MVKPKRRSQSQVVLRSRISNQNILSLSDTEQHTRNSDWWRNLSNDLIHDYLLTNSAESAGVLNSDSALQERTLNSAWFKNITQTGSILFVKPTRTSNNISHNQSDESIQISNNNDNNAEVRQSVFAMNLRSARPDFSNAFHLQNTTNVSRAQITEKSIENASLDAHESSEDSVSDQKSKTNKLKFFSDTKKQPSNRKFSNAFESNGDLQQFQLSETETDSKVSEEFASNLSKVIHVNHENDKQKLSENTEHKLGDNLENPIKIKETNGLSVENFTLSSDEDKQLTKKNKKSDSLNSDQAQFQIVNKNKQTQSNQFEKEKQLSEKSMTTEIGTHAIIESPLQRDTEKSNKNKERAADYVDTRLSNTNEEVIQTDVSPKSLADYSVNTITEESEHDELNKTQEKIFETRKHKQINNRGTKIKYSDAFELSNSNEELLKDLKTKTVETVKTNTNISQDNILFTSIQTIDEELAPNTKIKPSVSQISALTNSSKTTSDEESFASNQNKNQQKFLGICQQKQMSDRKTKFSNAFVLSVNNEESLKNVEIKPVQMLKTNTNSSEDNISSTNIQTKDGEFLQNKKLKPNVSQISAIADSFEISSDEESLADVHNKNQQKFFETYQQKQMNVRKTKRKFSNAFVPSDNNEESLKDAEKKTVETLKTNLKISEDIILSTNIQTKDGEFIQNKKFSHSAAADSFEISSDEGSLADERNKNKQKFFETCQQKQTNIRKTKAKFSNAFLLPDNNEGLLKDFKIEEKVQEQIASHEQNSSESIVASNSNNKSLKENREEKKKESNIQPEIISKLMDEVQYNVTYRKEQKTVTNLFIETPKNELLENTKKRRKTESKYSDEFENNDSNGLLEITDSKPRNKKVRNIFSKNRPEKLLNSTDDSKNIKKTRKYSEAFTSFTNAENSKYEESEKDTYKKNKTKIDDAHTVLENVEISFKEQCEIKNSRSQFNDHSPLKVKKRRTNQTINEDCKENIERSLRQMEKENFETVENNVEQEIIQGISNTLDAKNLSSKDVFRRKSRNSLFARISNKFKPIKENEYSENNELFKSSSPTPTGESSSLKDSFTSNMFKRSLISSTRVHVEYIDISSDERTSQQKPEESKIETSSVKNATEQQENSNELNLLKDLENSSDSEENLLANAWEKLSEDESISSLSTSENEIWSESKVVNPFTVSKTVSPIQTKEKQIDDKLSNNEDGVSISEKKSVFSDRKKNLNPNKHKINESHSLNIFDNGVENEQNENNISLNLKTSKSTTPANATNDKDISKISNKIETENVAVEYNSRDKFIDVNENQGINSTSIESPKLVVNSKKFEKNFENSVSKKKSTSAVKRKTENIYEWIKKMELKNISAEDVLEKPKRSEKEKLETERKLIEHFKMINTEKFRTVKIPEKKQMKKKKTAHLINGKPYRPKLYNKKPWCNARFYKFLQNKMSDKYGLRTIVESENLMIFIANSVTTIMKSKNYMPAKIEELKKQLAANNIISTTYDFFVFVDEYLPREFKEKVVPCTQAFKLEPTVPYDPKTLFQKI